jgi:phosphoribosylformimino-5-aminoimidazole carboxamide ribotide isomerase
VYFVSLWFKNLMLILPAIDLKNGSCVRLTQGEKDRVKVYDQDPVAMAERFAAAGAEILHLVDLDGAFSGGPSKNLEIVARIVTVLKIPVEFGGGVRDESAVERLVDLGVARIILGTIAVEAPELVASLAGRYGSRLAVGIDARDGKVATRGWEHRSEVEAIELAARVRDSGIERVIYTDIAQDGMLTGPNIEMTRRLARETGLKVTASGGVGSLDDLRRLKELEAYGVDSCIIGKALYEQRFTLQEAIIVSS